MKISVDFSSTICYNKRVMKMNYNYVARVVYLKSVHPHPSGRCSKLVSCLVASVLMLVWSALDMGSSPIPSIGTISYLTTSKSNTEKENKIMARVPMVTRTIVAIKVNVMCLDIEKGEPFNETVTVSRTYKDDNALMKKVRPLLETETVKAVHIVDKEEIETLYGMSEQEFIHYAKVLPPRNGVTSEKEVDNA